MRNSSSNMLAVLGILFAFSLPKAIWPAEAEHGYLQYTGYTITMIGQFQSAWQFPKEVFVILLPFNLYFLFVSRYFSTLQYI